ncbi:hypothetical protein JNK13_07580 [bacterium]|nr:hypothetical protein [bacterium]
MKQIPLRLEQSSYNAERFFVLHSGVITAYEALMQLVESLVLVERKFAPVFIYGQSGTGKSHFLSVILERARELGVLELLSYFDQNLGAHEDSWASEFVAKYESVKAQNGLMIICSQVHPSKFSTNPHIQSRIQTTEILELNFPTSVELKPILEAILTKRGLKLPQDMLDKIAKHSTRDLLSFDVVFSRLNELLLEDSKSLRSQHGRKLVSSALKFGLQDKLGG